ncbi:MAG: RNA ligase family protein [Myxococcota bacterium]
MDFRKYPRIRHLDGSARHGDDDALPFASLDELRGRRVVITEKLDGANAGVSFDTTGALVLQSRGHVLTGGARERHFALLKTWAQAHRDVLYDVLGERFTVYGEWLYARHTVFYDALPHYFVAFDALDRTAEAFLAGDARDELLAELPLAAPPRHFAGLLDDPRAVLDALPPRSACKTHRWREHLREAATEGEVGEWGDPERAIRETCPRDEAEGFVVVVEEDDRVVDRMKWVRRSFVTALEASGSHWLSRPILVNRLDEGVTLW